MSRQRMLATGQTGIVAFPLPAIRLIAASELCALMVGAAVAHARLREPRNVATDAVLFALALTVALGRFAQLG